MPPPWAAHLPPGPTPGDVQLASAGSLPAAWTARWAASGSSPVLHDEASGWVGAAELEERTRVVAARFAGAGLEPGDRILLSAAASVDLAVCHVAALRAGLVVIPANTAYREREVAHLVADARPRAAVVDDDARAQWIRDAASWFDVIVVGTDVALPEGPTPAHLDRATSGDAALVAYTSGTTGAPKGAVLTHGNLLASADALALAWRWDPDDRLVLPLPLFHMHGLGVGLHGTLGAGASAVIQPGFTADGVLDAVRDHHATLFFGVPTMWSRLADSPRAAELSSLRLGVSGSAPLDAELHRTLATRAGQTLIERYGMTETVMLTSNPYDGERRAGTVGLPLPGVELRLADDTDEILVRGPNVFGGYWEQPEATTASFADGWFATGDVGALDDHGYLRLVGRRKELIITGGYNVYPREVEDVVRAHPAVADVAVVGVPDLDWGEVVVAAAEPAGTASIAEAEAVLAATADHLAPYKCPRRLVWVGALPRNALGKVIKAEVVDLVT